MDILILEDEAQIAEVVGYLKDDGFSTYVCSTCAAATAWLALHRPDLALLDVALAGGNGPDMLDLLRDREVPVILLTQPGGELDRVAGSEADACITKPFSSREVVARARAVLRRVRPRGRAGDDVIQVGELELNVDAHEVHVGGLPANLTPSEFRLLEVLARNAGHALTRAQLLDKLSDGGSIYERTLDRHINNLRRKIEPDVRNPSYVVTVYGIGYKVRRP